MHTAALCSPSRSCILTGRNHHSNHISCITEAATGFPGSDGRMPFENGMISEILKPQGYNTFITGKWHVAPSEDSSPAGPVRPLADRSRLRALLRLARLRVQQLVSRSSSMTTIRSRPQKTPEEGYHLDEDTVDHAIRFILDAHINAPDKPFLLYHACAAGKSPHHSPKEWIEKYNGKFDMGWDEYRRIVFARQKEMGIVAADAELPPHDPDVPEWDSLSADQKRLYARMMQVYAGFVSHADHQFARIIAHPGEDRRARQHADHGDLRQRCECRGRRPGQVHRDELHQLRRGEGRGDHRPHRRARRPDLLRALRLGLGDGRQHTVQALEARGLPRRLHGPLHHALAGRQSSSRAGCAVSTRTSSTWCPTVLDLLGIEPPEAINGVKQAPIEGVSFAHTVNDAQAPTRHTTQYFEMLGTRAIDHDGWRAVCGWPGPSLAEGAAKGRRLFDQITPEVLKVLDAEEWQLFNIARDPAESHDLASQHTEKLRELIDLWWVEAEKYHVLPLDGTFLQRGATERPRATKAREQFVYYPGLSVVPTFNTPPILNRSHSHHRRARYPARRGRGRHSCPGWLYRRLCPLRPGRSAALRPQLHRQEPL